MFDGATKTFLAFLAALVLTLFGIVVIAQPDPGTGNGIIEGSWFPGGSAVNDTDLNTHKLYWAKTTDPDTYCVRSGADEVTCYAGGNDTIKFNASKIFIGGNIDLQAYILYGDHVSDNNTYLEYPAADTWRLVTGGRTWTFTEDTFTAQAGNEIWADTWGFTSDADTATYLSGTNEVTHKAGGVSSLVVSDSDVDYGVPATFSKGTTYPLPSTATVTANAATIDFAGGDLIVLDMNGSTGDVTLTFSNPRVGWLGVKIIQGSNLDDAIYPANVEWPSDVVPVLTATDDAVDVLTCMYDGTDYFCSMTQNYTP